MKNLSYALVEAIAFPVRKLLLVTLISFIFLESFTTIQIALDFFQKKNHFESIFKDNSVISLFDTTFSVSIAEQEVILAEVEQLTGNQFLYYSKFPAQATVVDTSAFYFPGNQIGDVLLDDGSVGNVPNMIEANQAFFKRFPVTMAKGRFFSVEDFQKDTQVVILGSDYEGHYQLGEKIRFGHMDDRYLAGEKESLESLEFEIIGFLTPQAQIDFSSGEASFSQQSLNQQMLFPRDQLNETLSLNDLDQYHLMIPTEELTALPIERLNELLGSLNKRMAPIQLTLNDNSELMSSQLEMLNRDLMQSLVRLIIVIIFTSVSFVISFKEMIKQRYQVFYVYLSIGSTKRDIMVINYLMVWVIVTISFGFCFLLNYLSVNIAPMPRSSSPSILTILVSYVSFNLWFSLLLLPTLLKIKMTNISGQLKEALI